MEQKTSFGIGYLMHLAGRQKWFLLLSAIFAVLSALCTFIPFVMVYQVLLFLFGGGADVSAAIGYGVTAALAIVGKFGFSIISGIFSHLGAFNTLYNVRAAISRHIAKINLGFFTANTTGGIKKVVIEDVERIEKFLAHQIPDLTSAICVPIIVFIYLLTLSVPMALCLLVPVVLGAIIQGIAMAVTGKQMSTYHRLLAKLNATIMQFINGMPVMKTFGLTAKGYREYADTVTEYNAFWKGCTRDQGYTYGIFVALVESGTLFSLPLGATFFCRAACRWAATSSS